MEKDELITTSEVMKKYGLSYAKALELMNIANREMIKQGFITYRKNRELYVPHYLIRKELGL